MQRIVIIGGGISGHLVLINLLRLSPVKAMQITLVEKIQGKKLGSAFSVEEDIFLLNVPAGNMSAFVDEKDHFVSWLESSGYAFNAMSYVPRMIYRDYIREVLSWSMGSPFCIHKASLIDDEVVDIDRGDKIVYLKSGQLLGFDKAILAIGHFQNKELPLEGNAYRCSKFYHHSHWAENMYAEVKADERILILGTGLTMIDTVLSLHNRRHRGKIIALSRHGILPAENGLSGDRYDLEGMLFSENSLTEMLRLIRRQVQMAMMQGKEWQWVIDSLRPYTNKIWMRLRHSERIAFLNHLRHYWDAARHRVPPEIYAIITKAIAEGRLVVEAGRIAHIGCVSEQGLEVTWRSRKSDRITLVRDVRIINCMGPETNYKFIDSPLVRNLMRRGVIVSDELQLGICSSPEGSVIGVDGSPMDDLFSLGAPLKGVLWETTAVPEIRMQAYKLAKQI